MELTTNTILVCAVTAVLAWLGMCSLFFAYLRKNHSQTFEALGRPGLIENNRPIHSAQLLSYLFRSPSGVDDPVLRRIIWVMRIQFTACFVIVAMLFVRVTGLLMVDDCLDRGGCWVGGENRCEFHDQTACTIGPRDRLTSWRRQ